jgi:hypothetical protein
MVAPLFPRLLRESGPPIVWARSPLVPVSELSTPILNCALDSRRVAVIAPDCSLRERPALSQKARQGWGNPHFESREQVVAEIRRPHQKLALGGAPDECVRRYMNIA